jgi:excisionase family DNA binding protein
MTVETVLLKVPQAATYLNVSCSQVRALVRTRELPSVHVGGAVRIPRQQLEDWLTRQAQDWNGAALSV